MTPPPNPHERSRDGNAADLSARALRWPPERFFWSVVEGPAPPLRGPGPVPPGLVPVLEEDIPLPAGSLHAVCAPGRDGGVIVCAAHRDDLNGLPPWVLTLTPASLPAFAEGACDTDDLNLLVGGLEPGPVRRARTLSHALAAATLVLCAGLVALGLARRASAWNADASSARDRTAALVRAAVPGAGASPTALAAEIGRLRREAEARSRAAPPPDAALNLAAVLAGWPAAVPSKAQSIAVGPAGASISLAVEGDPSPFLQSLRPPEGWTLDEPRLNTSDRLTRVFVRIRPKEGAAP